MKCLSCKQPFTGPVYFFQDTVALCDMCLVLANKKLEDIEAGIQATRVTMHRILEHHILNGGLLRPGSGMEEYGEEEPQSG